MSHSLPYYHPLDSLDSWEDFLAARYPEQPTSSFKNHDDYRNYESSQNEAIKEFYRLNHTGQTYDFVRGKEDDYLARNRRQMSIWEAMEFLNQLADDSDPDTDLSQLQHLLQTSEAIRADGHPDWFVLAGLIHDLGKILCLFGEPQWAVVGDTFPVGCRYSEAVVYSEFFQHNPDYLNSTYQQPLGVYAEGCGLRNVHLSWGHDEYLYQIVKEYLPEPALYMIRYHSFYAAHREGAYAYLMDEHDRAMFTWVKKFNPYDLYSKNDAPPSVKELRPYYEKLIAKYLPETLRF